MPISIKERLNPKSFSTLVGVAGTAISIGAPFGIPLTIAICSLIYLYNANPNRYNKIIRKFSDKHGGTKLGELIEIIREGDANKIKIKENLCTIKEDKELQHNIEKFSTADYSNKEEFENGLHELLCTETKNDAFRLYSELIVFNQENLKVILSEITGLGEKQKEILNEFNRRFDDLNENLERFKGEIVEEFRETELYKEGFEIITSDYFSKYGPNKNCWDKGFRLIDVWHNYDARREITDEVEKALEEKDVLVLGKSGFGKTTFLYRIIVDFVKNGYTILYKEKDTTLEHPESVAETIKKYSRDKNLLVVVDNVHLQNNINAFYIVDDLKRHENRSKIKFFFTAKEPDFTDFLREGKDFWIKNPELKKIVKTIKKEMENFNLDNLTLSEGELFVKKYFEVVKNKVVPDEVIKIGLPAHYKWSKEGDPLLFTIYLTNEKRGIRQDIDYKFDRYVKDIPEKDFMLLTCLLESTNLEVKTEYLEGILKLSEEDYVDIVDDLLEYTLIYTKDRTKFWTRHQRWAVEYLKCIYYEKEKKSRRYRLSEKVENLTSALFDLKDEVLAYKFVVGLSKLIVYNKELRGLLLPSLKVPGFLSKDTMAELYTFDVREVYYWIHEYDKAINACTKAIELNPGLAAAYLSRGAIYADKKEFDRAIEDFNKGVDLNPNLALAYNGRGTVYLEKEDFDKAIEDFNKEIELGSFFEAGAYCNRGIAYIDKGEFDKAIEDFNKAIDLAPEYAKAYSSRGSAYAEKGELDRAIEDYNEAIGLNPKLAYAYNNRGVTYRKKGELDKAIQDYDTAIELEPDDGVAYSNRGVAYEEKGEFDKSIDDCNKAIELNPQDAKAYNNRGNAYADKEELDKAIEDFNKAIELNPELADAYNNRGLTYKNKGEFDKAIEDCNKAIELDPSFADAYNNRGLVYKEKGDFDKAIEDYNRALELDPKDNGTYYNNRGIAYEGKGEFDTAIEDFNRALELNPKLVKAYNNRGVAYKGKGEFDTAIENYNKALELNPGYYDAYSNRGVAYHAKGDFDKVIENYKEAIKLNPKLADAYYNRGNAYSDRGEYDKAIEDFTKAIELRPDYAEAYYNRGNGYFKKGDFNRAIENYDKAIELKPDLAFVYSNRANVYFEKEDYDRAIQDFSKVIELKPDNARAYSGRGNAYACKNELDKAIEDYNKAIELKPDHIEGLYSIQMILYGIKGDIGKAIEKYTKAKELNPEVDIYGSNETFEKAIQNLRSIGSFGFEWFIKTQRAISTELKPDDMAMEHYKRGYTYWIKQEFDKAIDEFDRVIELKPNFGMAYFIQGQIYLKKEEFDKAIDDYNKVIELNPNDATAYHDRGLAYKRKGEYDKAIQDFNKAIDINPKIARLVYHNLGLVYVNKEEFDKAIEYITKTIEIKPDYAEAYYTRGECYRQRNDFIKCANDFFISAFLLFMQKRGNEALKLIKATYDLKDIIDSPVCFECGAVLVAFAEVIGFDPKCAEEHAKRIEDIQKHREEISKSARIVLDYLVSGEVQEEIEVKDVRDDVFKSLLVGLQNRDKIG